MTAAARSITDADVDAIASAVAAKIGTPAPALKIAVTVAELQAALGTSSRWATHQQIKRLGLKPYSRGHYRLRDVENAIARRTRA